MGSWDFVDTWSTSRNGTGYPLLNWQAPNPTPTPAPSSSNGPASLPQNLQVTCTAFIPNGAPNLFLIKPGKSSATLYFAPVTGQNTGYTISYGLNPEANQFATMFNYGFSGGVIPYTINYLFPATWYFKVSGMNTCMPGSWSQTQSVKIK